MGSILKRYFWGWAPQGRRLDRTGGECFHAAPLMPMSASERSAHTRVLSIRSDKAAIKSGKRRLEEGVRVMLLKKCL